MGIRLFLNSNWLENTISQLEREAKTHRVAINAKVIEIKSRVLDASNPTTPSQSYILISKIKLGMFHIGQRKVI